MELKLGGLYASKNDRGKYTIVKILALDDFAIHVRFYNEEFKDVPSTISSQELTYLIGHAPISRSGFTNNDRRILVAIENVLPEELEGYRLYLEAMSK